jgi:hypothetical protein
MGFCREWVREVCGHTIGFNIDVKSPPKNKVTL